MEPGNFVGSIALFYFRYSSFIYKINNNNNNTLLLIISLAFIGVGGILFFMSIPSDDGLKVFVIIFVIFIAILAISSFISNSSRISRENENGAKLTPCMTDIVRMTAIIIMTKAVIKWKKHGKA